MTGQHRFRSSDAKGAAQGHHTFANSDLAHTRLARAEDDKLCSLEIQQRRFQTCEQPVFGGIVRDPARMIRSRQRDAATDHRIFPIVLLPNAKRLALRFESKT
jgi:hypothetical protein